jgi:leucyl-tRNA synthetase
LAKAKEETYTKGFYEGIMCGEAVGKYQGMKVIDAKTLVREELIKSGQALAYFEPENKVISRSQDECIVALCD